MKRTKHKNKPKVIGYMRVSTIEQDTQKNEAQILKFANSHDFGKVQFVSEKISGMKDWKNRKLFDVVQELQENDILIVPELSRLGRSIVNILELLKVLSDKKIKVYSVKENFQINGNDMQSKMMRTLLALFAEIERDLISERTKEGLAAARAKGKILGRPKGRGKSKLDVHKEEIISLLKTGSKNNYIAKKYHCTPGNLTNWLKRNELTNVKPEY